MSAIKNAIESANKITNHIVTISENEDDPEEMYDTLFVILFDFLKAYDSKTLETLNHNLDEYFK